MKVRVHRVVVRGLTVPPEPAELRERVVEEVRTALRATDGFATVRDPAALVAGAVARAAGGGRE